MTHSSDKDAHQLPTARVANNQLVLFLGMLVFLGIALWGAYRVIHHFNGAYVPSLWPVFMFSFVMFAFQQILAYVDHIKVGHLDTSSNVAILVPLYNEDPALIHQSLDSMFRQTRLPNSIHVTDDGSGVKDLDYTCVKVWFLEKCTSLSIAGYWTKTDNQGKRHAQAVGIQDSPEATIYATVDSDSVLDPHAIEEGLKPFQDPRVASVAGAVFSLKNIVNWLSRITDVLFVSQQQLSDRSSLSTVGSVLVNSGGLAFYRAHILRKNLDAYLSEMFGGKPVMFSDDSLLTLYALQEGKTVQQRSSIVFCAMPEDLSHHVKQQLRWFRGSFIRSFWRIRYLPVFSWGFARQVFGWIQLALTTIASITLFVVYPLTQHRFAVEILIVPLVMSYAQGLRYFTYVRSDTSRSQQAVNFLLIPLAWVWQFTVLRFLRFYGMATCRNTGWNTRGQVEVFADSASQATPRSSTPSMTQPLYDTQTAPIHIAQPPKHTPKGEEQTE